MAGKIYGIGVGPGEPELMTLKAVRRIREADVIAIPGKDRETCTAWQIAKQAVPEIEEKELLPVVFPMTKDETLLEQSHAAAAALVAERLERGKTVAFLTLGDPTVYSTWLYLHKRLRNMGFEPEIVSGVPSFCAAAARLGVSLGEKAEAIHILPGSYPLADALGLAGTKVLMKSGGQIGKVKTELLERGIRSMMVENCGMDGERVFEHTEDIPADAGYYSLILIRDAENEAGDRPSGRTASGMQEAAGERPSGRAASGMQEAAGERPSGRTAPEMQEAMGGRAVREEIAGAAISPADVPGMVYLVGAGPGEPGLLTVRGRELLSRAETLVYDRLASPGLLELVPAGCEKIYAGKEAGHHTMKQEEISRLLAEKAGEGRLVVRLKGGDPFVFGRGGEEILELERHGIPYEVVPGVTSAIAALSHAGIPVTHRELARSFHVITGHRAGEEEDFSDYENYAKLSGTLVFLMGLSNLEHIVEALLCGGMSPETPAAVVCSGTLPEEICVRAGLAELPRAARRAGLKSPGIIVVGETAALKLNSGRSSLPLSGVSVGLTGTAETCGRISERLDRLGARTVRVMESRIRKINQEKLYDVLRRLTSLDWIVFTSRNGVHCFFDAVKESRMDLRAFGMIRFAAVGTGTGEALDSYGFHADYIPEAYTTRALGEGLCRLVRPEEGRRVLLARAQKGSEILPEILMNGGWTVTELPVYDLETEAPRSERLAGLQYLVFASGSGIRGFFAEAEEEMRRRLSGVRPVCIGPETAKLLSDFGVENFLTAGEYTAEGIVKAILEDRKNGNVQI